MPLLHLTPPNEVSSSTGEVSRTYYTTTQQQTTTTHYTLLCMSMHDACYHRNSPPLSLLSFFFLHCAFLWFHVPLLHYMSIWTRFCFCLSFPAKTKGKKASEQVTLRGIIHISSSLPSIHYVFVLLGKNHTCMRISLHNSPLYSSFTLFSSSHLLLEKSPFLFFFGLVRFFLSFSALLFSFLLLSFSGPWGLCGCWLSIPFIHRFYPLILDVYGRSSSSFFSFFFYATWSSQQGPKVCST